MSRSGRAQDFMREWGEGHNAEHGYHEWGADPCARCTADTYDPWEALVHAAEIMGWIEPR